MKRILILLTTLLILAMTSLTVSAAPLNVVANENFDEDYELISPMFLDIYDIDFATGINGSTFSAYISMSSKTGSSFTCTYTLYLERYNNGGWTTAGTSYGGGTGTKIVNQPHSFPLSTRGTYRVKLVGTVTGKNGTESISATSASKVY